MLLLVDGLLFATVVVLMTPVAVFVVECVLGSLPGRPKSSATAETRLPSVVVLVPAHDEALDLPSTLRDLQPQLQNGMRVLVVADNCTDETAHIAREHGAEVVERVAPEHRGKGYALAFGLAHLAKAPPEVVIIFDADCRVTEGSLAALAREVEVTGRPVQAEYVIEPLSSSAPKSVISALAFMVKNRVRPRGLARLGWPVSLTGSGMALPWPLVENCQETRAALVEDMLMGIDMAMQGAPPRLASHVEVVSSLPDSDAAAAGQRRRWEHGHLATLLRYGPRLIGAGLRRGRWGLIVMGFDLAVPPLAFLVLLQMVFVIVATAAAFLGASPWPALLGWSSLGALAMAVIVAWLAHGRRQVPLRYLLAIPQYVIWKLPIYGGFLARKPQTEWVRTRRRARHPNR